MNTFSHTDVQAFWILLTRPIFILIHYTVFDVKKKGPVDTVFAKQKDYKDAL